MSFKISASNGDKTEGTVGGGGETEYVSVSVCVCACVPVCVCWGRHTCATIHMSRSEDNFGILFLFLFHVGPEDPTQVMGLWQHTLSHLTHSDY